MTCFPFQINWQQTGVPSGGLINPFSPLVLRRASDNLKPRLSGANRRGRQLSFLTPWCSSISSGDLLRGDQPAIMRRTASPSHENFQYGLPSMIRRDESVTSWTCRSQKRAYADSGTNPCGGIIMWNSEEFKGRVAVVTG